METNFPTFKAVKKRNNEDAKPWYHHPSINTAPMLFLYFSFNKSNSCDLLSLFININGGSWWTRSWLARWTRSWLARWTIWGTHQRASRWQLALDHLTPGWRKQCWGCSWSHDQEPSFSVFWSYYQRYWECTANLFPANPYEFPDHGFITWEENRQNDK